MQRTAACRIHLRLVSFAALTAIVAGALSTAANAAEDANGVERAKDLSRAFRAAAKKMMPTVVKIRTTTRPRAVEGRNAPREGFRGIPFDEFFEEMPEFDAPRRSPQRQGLGSGVIIDPSGIILTNEHVVQGADEVLIELSDGRQFKATDLKFDPDSDLAVLRIKADEPLPAAVLGDSDKLDIGDWVLAIGNPFELDLTVSAGIISSKSRALPSSKRASFLQTDAAINPGNSGGPLVSIDGEVIGINTAIASSTGVYEGVGFAIPSNLAKWVADQLIDKGVVQRAYLGVAIAELTPQLAERLALGRQRGVIVSEVFPKSPAAEAGFEAGDLIVTFAGRPVANPRQLQEVVERAAADSKQQVAVIRDGKPTTLSVVVRPLPKDFGVAASPPRRPQAEREDLPVFDELGLQIADMDAELAQRLGIQAGSGVAIAGVAPGGLADSAGLRPGMAIIRVGKKAVTSAADFKAAVKGESLQDGVMLLVRTAEGNRFVVLQAS